MPQEAIERLERARRAYEAGSATSVEAALRSGAGEGGDMSPPPPAAPAKQMDPKLYDLLQSIKESLEGVGSRLKNVERRQERLEQRFQLEEASPQAREEAATQRPRQREDSPRVKSAKVLSGVMLGRPLMPFNNWMWGSLGGVAVTAGALVFTVVSAMDGQDHLALLFATVSFVGSVVTVYLISKGRKIMRETIESADDTVAEAMDEEAMAENYRRLKRELWDPERAW